MNVHLESRSLPSPIPYGIVRRVIMHPNVVCVVIPNWNRRKLLQACLDSLDLQDFLGFSTLVVDNGSRDGSVAMVRKRYGHVKLITLARNSGFAAAVNRGIRQSHSEFVALLNNDMVVDERWLSALVAAARRHPEAGLFASRMLRSDDSRRLDAAGDGLRRSGRSYGIGRGELDGPRFRKEKPVFGASAGAALYRRRMLEEVGEFDEDFFAYVEDTDLAWRAQIRGWSCYFVPDAVAHHKGSASLRGREDRRSLLCLRNYVYFLLKDYPLGLMLRNLPAVLGGLAQELRFTFGAVRSRRGGWAALRGLARVARQVLAGSPRMLRKRSAVRRSCKLTPDRLRELFD
jgi:GT2 family glycosyltransferase